MKYPFFLSPLSPLLLNLFVYISSFFVYKININTDNIWLIYILILITGIIFSSLSLNFSRFDISVIDVPFIRFLISLIFVVSIFEYLTMGVPILGTIVYADFGYPFLHHIAVFSWIIVFGINKFRSKYIRFLLILFFILNPILMQNRDLLLISVFMMLIYFWMHGYIKYKSLLIVFFMSLILFGLLGNIRSPYAIKALTLPFSFNLDDINPIFIWVLLYITSSSFNFYYNIDMLTMNLFSSNINVFPEPYGWSVKFSSIFVFYGYFLLSLSILYFISYVCLSKKNNHYWKIFYFYLIYQSYMSIFSTKFFTTNALFVFIVFFSLTILSKYIKSR